VRTRNCGEARNLPRRASRFRPRALSTAGRDM
jgi:hypothetical protein